MEPPQVGQCNDAYSAVVIATKLAEALECHLGSNKKADILIWVFPKIGVPQNGW